MKIYPILIEVKLPDDGITPWNVRQVADMAAAAADQLTNELAVAFANKDHVRAAALCQQIAASFLLRAEIERARAIFSGQLKAAQQ